MSICISPTLPRFYQSLSLLGSAGSTEIEPKKDERLLEKWKKSDLWPVTREQETSIAGERGNPYSFSNFCPEVAHDRFGFFASFLSYYADEIDREIAHKDLIKEGALRGDWRWAWAYASPMHYTNALFTRRSISMPLDQANEKTKQMRLAVSGKRFFGWSGLGAPFGEASCLQLWFFSHWASLSGRRCPTRLKSDFWTHSRAKRSINLRHLSIEPKPSSGWLFAFLRAGLCGVDCRIAV